MSWNNVIPAWLILEMQKKSEVTQDTRKGPLKPIKSSKEPKKTTKGVKKA